jgi:hypothetical protein
MKYIFLIFIAVLELFGGIVTAPIISVDADETVATIKIKKVKIGMSGFIFHKVAKNHGSILKNAVVVEYDVNTKIATLKLSKYDNLVNPALPSGKWKVQKDDLCILAFGYSRALLIAPTEDIYYKIAKHTNFELIHPDIFATFLSLSQHPTPLLEDFDNMRKATQTGIVFIYLDNTIYTVDAKTFAILNISKNSLKQDEKTLVLPFYTRVPEIRSAWYSWGAGTSELEEYEPHYYSLLVEANPKNKSLYEKVKKQGEKLSFLLDDFKLKEIK